MIILSELLIPEQSHFDDDSGDIAEGKQAHSQRGREENKEEEWNP